MISASLFVLLALGTAVPPVAAAPHPTPAPQPQGPPIPIPYPVITSFTFSYTIMHSHSMAGDYSDKHDIKTVHDESLEFDSDSSPIGVNPHRKGIKGAKGVKFGPYHPDPAHAADVLGSSSDSSQDHGSGSGIFDGGAPVPVPNSGAAPPVGRKKNSLGGSADYVDNEATSKSTSSESETRSSSSDVKATTSTEVSGFGARTIKKLLDKLHRHKHHGSYIIGESVAEIIRYGAKKAVDSILDAIRRHHRRKHPKKTPVADVVSSAVPLASNSSTVSYSSTVANASTISNASTVFNSSMPSVTSVTAVTSVTYLSSEASFVTSFVSSEPTLVPAPEPASLPASVPAPEPTGLTEEDEADIEAELDQDELDPELEAEILAVMQQALFVQPPEALAGLPEKAAAASASAAENATAVSSSAESLPSRVVDLHNFDDLEFPDLPPMYGYGDEDGISNAPDLHGRPTPSAVPEAPTPPPSMRVPRPTTLQTVTRSYVEDMHDLPSRASRPVPTRTGQSVDDKMAQADDELAALEHDEHLPNDDSPFAPDKKELADAFGDVDGF